MNFDGAFLEAIKKIVPSENILLNEPLAKHTTFKIGGPADIFINVSSTQEVSQIIKLCEENQVNLHVLGNGSNILVLDKGIRGVLVKFGQNFAKMKFENNRFIVGAGALLKDVANFAAQNGHSGMEFAVGIPRWLFKKISNNLSISNSTLSQLQFDKIRYLNVRLIVQ